MDRISSLLNFPGMFEEWKKAWDQAVRNFQRELRADDQDFTTPGQRLHAMRRDLAAAKDALLRLQAQITEAREEAAAEGANEKTARRRASMAESIGDTETVRVALEFARRHAERSAILVRKAEVLQEELQMRQNELAIMEQQAGPEIARAASAAASDLFDRSKQDADFRRLDRERREKEAEARLEELKKKMK